MRENPRRLTLKLAAACVAAASVLGCASPDDGVQAELEQLRQDVASDQADATAELAERLDRREQADRELNARLDALEEQLGSALEADETAQRLDEVDADIGSLMDALTVLEEDLAAERSARETLDANTGAASQELRDSVAELRGSISNLRGEIALVSDAVDALRDRLDRLGAN